MPVPQHSLAHLPFFERLAALDEENAEFRAVTAGLVTLRLFDAWVMDGRELAAETSWGGRAVRQAIEAMDEGSVARSLLLSTVESMDPDARVARTDLVLPRLMAYARSLQFDGAWALAADVYRTVLTHAHPLNDADAVITANLQMAICLRTGARWDEAWEAYGDAGEAAALAGDVMNMLKARIGSTTAALAVIIGEMPAGSIRPPLA